MRADRVLTGLVGLALLTPAMHGGAATAADRADRALPKREISSRIQDSDNRLVFRGNVSPGHAGKPVFIQKKKCKAERCAWRKFVKVTTNDTGGFRARVTAPRDGYWYWRAKVRKHDGYATSYSDVWRTFVI